MSAAHERHTIQLPVTCLQKLAARQHAGNGIKRINGFEHGAVGAHSENGSAGMVASVTGHSHQLKILCKAEIKECARHNEDNW